MEVTEEQFDKNLAAAAELFKLDNELKSNEDISFAFSSLKAYWRHDDDFLMKVAVEFESADEGNFFLNILNGADDIQEAWVQYCDERDMPWEGSVNPFID